MSISAITTRSIAVASGIFALSIAVPPTIDESVEVSTPIIVAFYVVALASFAVAVVAHHSYRNTANLRKSMRETSSGIFDLLRIHGIRAPNPASFDPNYGAKYVAHSADLMSEYDLRFGAKALALFGKAQRRGWIAADERHMFEHPTNPNGVRQIAQTLGAMGERE